MKFLNNILNSKKGFVLLYAILIIGLILALTFSITNITIKERKLSRLSEESFSAFFAAESGMECALYWDLKDSESWFRYDPTEPGGRNITCNGQTFTVGNEEGEVNEMEILFSDSSNSSVVVVDKSVEDSTSLLSSGYSVDDSTVGSGVERGISVKYGDEVDDFEGQCEAFDLILVLDNSGSIEAVNLDGDNEQELLKDAAKKIVNNEKNILAEDSFKMGIVSFDYGADLREGLTIEKDNLENAIDSLSFPGNTNMEAGLFIAQNEVLSSRARNDAKDIVVLITDGETNQCIMGKEKYNHDVDPSVHQVDDGISAYDFDCNDSLAKDSAEDVATDLYNQDVTVIVVGVGVTNQYANYLRQKIASKPNDYEGVEKFEDLEKLLKKFDCSYFMRAVSNVEREEF